MGYVLGIDVGTTFSAAAVAEAGRAEIFTLGHNSPTIPSVVLLRADGEVLVGEAAERRALTEPNRVARQFKRRLGDPVPMLLGGTPYGAETLYGHLLASIATRVTRERGAPPDVVVLSHPASWGPYKTDLLQQAARQAGLGRVRLITEPEAAAIYYAHRQHLASGDVVAVYDFGGGTFDATVLRTTDTGFELLGDPEGMERLGGIDFDEAIFGKVRRDLGAALDDIDDTNAAHVAAVAQIRQQCRSAKEALSVDTDATIPVLLPDVHSEVIVTRGEFEDMIRPRIRESIAALERAVRSADLTYDDVDRVLLVGGSSRIPLIEREIEAATGRPVAIDANPKYAIALGAALAVSGVAPEAAVAAPTTPAAPVPTPAAPTTPAAPVPPVPAPHTVAAPPPAPASDPWTTVVAADAGGPAPVGSSPAAPPPVDPPPVQHGAGVPEPAPLRADPPGPGGRPGSKKPLIAAAVVAALVVIVGAFVVLGGSGDDDDAGSVLTTSPATTTAGTAPTTTAATATTRAPAPTTTAAPSGPRVTITGVQLRAGSYAVAYTTNYDASIQDPSKLHIHFYFDTVSEAQAGVPGAGPWILYDTPAPFTQYRVADRPAGATRMCASVATHDHRVVVGTQSCAPLPS